VIAYFSRLRPAARTVIVAAGYVVTVALTALVLHVYVAVTNTPDRQTSSGMFAFGDSLVFSRYSASRLFRRQAPRSTS
jgi:hypothetical protein